MNREFWNGRRVFVTGHTGFKGAWLCLLLERLGATVAGYALAPPTDPSLYDRADAGARVVNTTADLRELGRLTEAMRAFEPEVVLHLAAQSVVLTAYAAPVDTFATNVLGTVHVLEAIRTALAGTPRAQPLAVVNVTTDKAYLNQRWPWPYRETDTLGGRDPYSNSKACAELVMQSYRDSYFPAERLAEHGVALASARAGNVVGGGDWTPHQLVPAVIAAAQRGEAVALRNPAGVRPWQHVLDCLHGYLTLAEQLALAPQVAIGQWNFGPRADEVYTVAQVSELIARHWGVEPAWTTASAETPREEHELRLDCSLAERQLKWRCALDTPTAFDWVADWHLRVERGATARQACEAQIDAFLAHPGVLRA